jgi:hypothetical protein
MFRNLVKNPKVENRASFDGKSSNFLRLPGTGKAVGDFLVGFLYPVC